MKKPPGVPPEVAAVIEVRLVSDMLKSLDIDLLRRIIKAGRESSLPPAARECQAEAELILFTAETLKEYARIAALSRPKPEAPQL